MIGHFPSLTASFWRHSFWHFWLIIADTCVAALKAIYIMKDDKSRNSQVTTLDGARYSSTYRDELAIFNIHHYNCVIFSRTCQLRLYNVFHPGTIKSRFHLEKKIHCTLVL